MQLLSAFLESVHIACYFMWKWRKSKGVKYHHPTQLIYKIANKIKEKERKEKKGRQKMEQHWTTLTLKIIDLFKLFSEKTTTFPGVWDAFSF